MYLTQAHPGTREKQEKPYKGIYNRQKVNLRQVCRASELDLSITTVWLNSQQYLFWYWFVERKLTLSSKFRCDLIRRYEPGHTLLYYLSQTWMFNKYKLNLSNTTNCC